VAAIGGHEERVRGRRRYAPAARESSILAGRGERSKSANREVGECEAAVRSGWGFGVVRHTAGRNDPVLPLDPALRFDPHDVPDVQIDLLGRGLLVGVVEVRHAVEDRRELLALGLSPHTSPAISRRNARTSSSSANASSAASAADSGTTGSMPAASGRQARRLHYPLPPRRPTRFAPRSSPLAHPATAHDSGVVRDVLHDHPERVRGLTLL